MLHEFYVYKIRLRSTVWLKKWPHSLLCLLIPAELEFLKNIAVALESSICRMKMHPLKYAIEGPTLL